MSSLSQTTELLQSVRGRHLSKTRIGYSDPDPCDEWAPAPIRSVCRDRAGRLRKRHEYLLETRGGSLCLWCGRVGRICNLMVV